MGYNENNTIAGAPTAGSYSIYIYILDTHPIFCLIN